MRIVRTKDTRPRIRGSWEYMRTGTLLRVEGDGCKREMKERVRERQRRGRMSDYSHDILV